MEYGVIGEHLKHSFSREIHRELASYEYIVREVEPSALADFIRSRDYKGLNVTIPYKKDVMPHLDHIDPIAREIGAVNTIVNRDGILYGYNTDFFGLSSLIRRADITIEGGKVLILGTGGTSVTARAVAYSMGAACVYRVSRHPSDGDISYDSAYQRHTDADVIINTTPVGMFPNTGACPIDLERFPQCRGVVDAIYNPLRSELVLQARERGIKATGGLYMLVAQAAKACALFLDDDRVLEDVEHVYNSIRLQKENIVLIGMPGSGKSTVGKTLSELMGRPFVDSDQVIISRTGKTISEIFVQDGEAAFRLIERQVIAELADKTGCIIATGGGVILNSNNVFNLRKNGRLVFRDRPLDELIPTGDRPLSSSREALERRYYERMPLYRAAADETVVGDTQLEAAQIIKRMWQV